MDVKQLLGLVIKCHKLSKYKHGYPNDALPDGFRPIWVILVAVPDLKTFVELKI